MLPRSIRSEQIRGFPSCTFVPFVINASIRRADEEGKAKGEDAAEFHSFGANTRISFVYLRDECFYTAVWDPAIVSEAIRLGSACPVSENPGLK